MLEMIFEELRDVGGSKCSVGLFDNVFKEKRQCFLIGGDLTHVLSTWFKMPLTVPMDNNQGICQLDIIKLNVDPDTNLCFAELSLRKQCWSLHSKEHLELDSKPSGSKMARRSSTTLSSDQPKKGQQARDPALTQMETCPWMTQTNVSCVSAESICCVLLKSSHITFQSITLCNQCSLNNSLIRPFLFSE